MVSRIKAINALRPKITLNRTVQQDELFEFITTRTGLTQGSIIFVLNEIHEAIVFYNSAGLGKSWRLWDYSSSRGKMPRCRA